MQPGYALGQFRDAGAEVDRLQRQASIVAAEEAALRSIGMPDAGRLLDLGCGPGFVAERLRRARPGLRPLGVDRDRRSLSLASGRIAAVAADVAALPVGGGLFDFAHLRLVLRHLPQPEAVLREARRALRPGGRVGVLDTDDGALVLHPVPPGFARVLAARQLTFQRRGADPFIGRRLAQLVTRAGFVDVQAIPLPVTSQDIGPAAFASIVLAPIADAVDPDLCPAAEVEEAARGLEAWGQRPDVFGLTTALLVGGRRPENEHGNLSS